MFDHGGEALVMLCLGHICSVPLPFPYESVRTPLVATCNGICSERGDRQLTQVKSFQDVDQIELFTVFVDLLGGSERVACSLRRQLRDVDGLAARRR